MSGLDHERVKEIFFEACTRPASARAGYLDEVCAVSPDLRREVEALLAFHQGDDPPRPLIDRPKPRPRNRFRRGQVLADRFRIERLIGRGGLGEVYAAFDRVLGVEVALKTLRVATVGATRRRLYEEVRLARQVSHPGVCRVYDIGEHDGTPFLTMQLIDGEDLGSRLAREGKWTSRGTAELGAELAEALAAAHASGVLHRDLKPENLLLDRDGRLRITDFGIAALRRRDRRGEPESTRSGTPAYMAPETAEPGQLPTEKSDLYSVGLVLYEMITGSLPFDAPDGATVLELHRSVPPEPPSRLVPDVDPRLEALVLRLLAKDPESRPASARDVSQALRALTGTDDARTEAHTAERRPLVTLLCEVAPGKTLDGAESRDLGALVRARSARVCVARGGRVARQAERGVLVQFGYRATSEHDVENAVHAGLEILEEWMSDSSVDHGRLPLAISVHAATAVIRPGRDGEPAISVETPEEERLRRMLRPEAVTVSGTTLPLLREALAVGRLETVDAVAAAIAADQDAVIREPRRRKAMIEHAEAGLTPLHGRDLEVAQLLRRFEDTLAGVGQVVLLSGEAGTGKSRLTHELWAAVSQRASGLEVHCRVSEQASPLAPFLDLVRRCAGFEDGEDVERRRSRVRALLEPLGEGAREVLPALLDWLMPTGDAPAAALAMVATNERRALLRGLVDWIVSLSATQPLVLIVDDLQWCDPTSLEAIDLLVEECRSARLLLVLAFRSELDARWKGPSITPIVLHPLRRDEARALVGAVAGPSLPPATVDGIVASADGNPLFLEEFVREARETGALVGGANASGDDVPITLRTLLQSKLDRLGSAKPVAQAAAACGRTFGQRLLAAVTGLEPEALDQRLERLRDAKLLHRRSAAPDAVYTWSHALIRDAAYASIPERERQALHRKVAEQLPVVDLEVSRGRPEVIAMHWTAGSRPGQAFAWWRRAGLSALQRCAYTEAASALGHAREALAPWRRETGAPPMAELELLLAMLSARSGHLRWVATDVQPILRRVRALCSRLDGGETLVLALYFLCRFKIGADDDRGLLPLLRRNDRLAARLGDPALTATVSSQLALYSALRGWYADALRHSERSLDIAVKRSEAAVAALTLEPRVVAAWARSLAQWATGGPASLQKSVDDAIAFVDATEHPNSRVFARVVQSHVLLLAGITDRADSLVREGRELAAGHELQGLFEVLRAFEQLIEAGRGDLEVDGPDPAWSEMGGQSSLRGAGRLAWAAALERAGESERALAVVEDECSRSQRSIARYLAPELHRRRGELLARMGRTAESLAAVRRSLALARRDAAHHLELQAALSLARTLAAAGSKRNAAALVRRTLERIGAVVDAAERGEAELLLGELARGEDRSRPPVTRRARAVVVRSRQRVRGTRV